MGLPEAIASSEGTSVSATELSEVIDGDRYLIGMLIRTVCQYEAVTIASRSLTITLG